VERAKVAEEGVAMTRRNLGQAADAQVRSAAAEMRWKISLRSLSRRAVA
jgi:hypothetical protein